ncbi:MAG: glycosyltransferase, partial [Acidimicrobiales bacterium]
MNLIVGRVGDASEPADTDTGQPAGMDVVIVTYQSAPHLGSCLASLPTNARVVVVDNNSTDDSAAIAGEHGVPVLRNAANRGFAAAANQGAAVGREDLILFLNPDAVVAPADLSRLAEAALDDDSIAVVGPCLVSPEGRGQRPWWPFPSPLGSWCEAAGIHRMGARLGPRQAAEPRNAGATDVAFVVGACFLVRRVAFEALGGFDEDFWLYGEEADFCRRAADTGWRVRYVPDAQAVHVGGGSSSGADGDVVREHFARGTDRVIRKHHGRAALLSHRLALLAGSAARVALLAGRPDHPAATERRLLVRRQLATLRAGPLSLAQAARPGGAEVNGPGSPIVDAPPPGQEELALPRRALSQVVMCSLEKWDETWRRNQFLVRELLADDPRLRVLFVEPPVDIAYQALGHLFGRASTETPGERRGLRPLTSDRRLWALRPGKLLPRVVGPFADRSLRRQVQRAATTLGFDHPTMWINDSAYAGLVSEVGWPALYDITDDWLEATCTPRERRRRQDREKVLLRQAAVVSACSQELVRRRGGRAVRLIPNAGDEHHFADPRPRPQDLPPGPCALYVGTLHEDRLDVDLLVQVARSMQSARIVLVGPDALAPASRDRLASEANIHILGARPFRDIPGYFQHADVVVVPHRVTPFTDSLDPIKAYEILAVGRPTVATPVAGFRDLGPPVRCASGSAFVEAVRRALAEPADSAPRPVPTWSERGTEFRGALIDAASTRRRLSVVYLDHCARLSGGEIALERLLSALEGLDAHVVLAEDGPLRVRLESAGISCELLSMRTATLAVHRDEVRPRRLPLAAMAGSVTYVIRLAFRLRKLQPDLVHSNSLKSGIYGSL